MRLNIFSVCFLFYSAVFFVPDVARADTLTLEDAFRQAFARSETLEIREQDIRIAEAHYLQALGTVLPQVQVSASELIQDTAPVAGGGDAIGQTFTRRSRPEVAVNVRQPLFQGLREFNALKVSGAERLRNTHQRDRAGQILFADVARAYYTVLELENERMILQNLRSTLLKRASELKGRIDLGKSRPSELLTTESETASIEADLQGTKGSVLTARDYLGFLVGEPVTERLVDEFPVPSKIGQVETYLPRRDQRPDLNASEEAVRLAKGRLDYEKGGRYPTLDFEGNYYPYRVGFQKDIDWDVNFLLTVPIFKGGATRGRIREAAALHKQSEFAHDEALRRAELEIRQAYNKLTTSRAREAALRRAEMKAGANYRSLGEEYGLGLINNLELLQSLRDWQQKKIAANRAYYETKLEYLGLRIATGNLPITEPAP